MNPCSKSSVLLSSYSNQLMWTILKQFDCDVKHKFTWHFVQTFCVVPLHPGSLHRNFSWLYSGQGSILSPRIALFGMGAARPFLLFLSNSASI